MISQQIQCNPSFQRDLNRIKIEIELEDAMATGSEILEVIELLKNANAYGEKYGNGFEDGFWQGYSFLHNKSMLRTKSIQDKHKRLRKRWGLD